MRRVPLAALSAYRRRVKIGGEMQHQTFVKLLGS